MSEMSITRADFNACGTEFLLRELELALTFMDLAVVSGCVDHSQSAHAHAVRAHQSVLRFLPAVRPELRERALIQRNLTRLESRMKIAGLSIDTILSA
ncbi:MAG TPA: hypothetical protein VHZ09_14305 [Acidobacteriaceae bacterium]|nr:hypothetical protein [Acidobacteriaceae bacterium]